MSNELLLTLRFVLNGLFATAVHYGVFMALLHWVGFRPAGIANGVAAIVGTVASYLGSRSFVFDTKKAHSNTLPRFLGLYLSVMLVHVVFVTMWSDVAGFAYSTGFLLATSIAVVVSYLGNRFIVFHEPHDAGERAR